MLLLSGFDQIHTAVPVLLELLKPRRPFDFTWCNELLPVCILIKEHWHAYFVVYKRWKEIENEHYSDGICTAWIHTEVKLSVPVSNETSNISTCFYSQNRGVRVSIWTTLKLNIFIIPYLACTFPKCVHNSAWRKKTEIRWIVVISSSSYFLLSKCRLAQF